MSKAETPATVDEYLASLPPDRREAIEAVRAHVNRNLPKGYEESLQYGMIGWCVPHRLFPAGYHCDPTKPLGFAALASQKGYMSLYLMSVYGSERHRTWFESAWRKTGKKLDMGKSCIRFTKVDDLALDVIGESIARIPVADYVAHYVKAREEHAAEKSAAKGKPRPRRKS